MRGNVYMSGPRLSRLTLILSPLLLQLTVMSACIEENRFATKTIGNEGSLSADDAAFRQGDGLLVDNAILAASCDIPTENMVVVKEVIEFETRESCSFGDNGNGEETQGIITARENQSQLISLTTNKVLCGLNLKSATDRIQYDDFLFLNLNKRLIIASEEPYAKLLSADTNDKLRKWDFSQVQNSALRLANGTPWCLGEGSCTVPGHDQEGAFAASFDFLSISNAAIAGQEDLEEEEKEEKEEKEEENKFRLAPELSNLNFELVITGDNDDGDCQHTGISMELELLYAP